MITCAASKLRSRWLWQGFRSVVLQQTTPQGRPTLTDTSIAQTEPVLVAIDISKARHKVLISVPGKKRRRRMTVLNQLDDFNRVITTLSEYGRPVRVAFEAAVLPWQRLVRIRLTAPVAPMLCWITPGSASSAALSLRPSWISFRSIPSSAAVAWGMSLPAPPFNQKIVQTLGARLYAPFRN